MYYGRQAVIFDEVDGMAGNEDRGGVAEINKMIKTAKMPIICIANDLSQKIKSLRGYCYELGFRKVPTKTIRAAMMTVAFREGEWARCGVKWLGCSFAQVPFACACACIFSHARLFPKALCSLTFPVLAHLLRPLTKQA
jgi:hypothetical protein